MCKRDKEPEEKNKDPKEKGQNSRAASGQEAGAEQDRASPGGDLSRGSGQIMLFVLVRRDDSDEALLLWRPLGRLSELHNSNSSKIRTNRLSTPQVSLANDERQLSAVLDALTATFLGLNPAGTRAGKDVVLGDSGCRPSLDEVARPPCAFRTLARCWATAVLRETAAGPKVGMGIYWSEHSSYNVSQLSSIDCLYAGAIKAVCKAVETTKRLNYDMLEMHIGNADVHKMITCWLPFWVQVNWRPVEGVRLIHEDLWRQFYELSKDLNAVWLFTEEAEEEEMQRCRLLADDAVQQGT